MKSSLFLVLAIVAEVAATSFLKESHQFTKLVPSVITAVGYAAAFFFLSHALKAIPVGIAYAVWSGLGTVLIVLVGRFVFRQHLDAAAVTGLVLIVAGVVCINMFSGSSGH